MTTEKTWTDQPDIVETGEIICRGGIRVKEQFGEVRRLDDGSYTLTFGNLFGSQTILCASAEAAFRAISAADGTVGPMLPPDGCRLLANSGKEG